MPPKLDYSEYQQLFSTNGMSYLTSDIFMGHYKSLDAVTTFIDDKWTSFLLKRIIEKTHQDGLKTFSDTKLFNQFKQNLEDYYKRATSFFENLLKLEQISEGQCREALKLLSENFVHYSKTEFFYVDEAYKIKDQNPVIAENLAKFETLKNESRAKTNSIFYQPGSPRKQFLKKLCVQFSLTIDQISMYSKEDVLNLYSGKKVNEKDVKEREDSYLMCSTKNKISYFQGNQSKEIIKQFHPVDSGKQKTLKGTIVSKGIITAPVTIIKYGGNAFSRLSQIIGDMPEGNVLVADTTGPELILACKKSSAILTNQGGMMSHAAIVSRELKIPCVVGLKNITELVQSGDVVEVDADKGLVTILNK